MVSQLTKGVDRAVRLYNEEKPHSSLGRMTPLEFEKQLSILKEQNKPKMIKSSYAKNKFTGHRALVNLGKTSLQNPNVTSANQPKVS